MPLSDGRITSRAYWRGFPKPGRPIVTKRSVLGTPAFAALKERHWPCPSYHAFRLPRLHFGSSMWLKSASCGNEQPFRRLSTANPPNFPDDGAGLVDPAPARAPSAPRKRMRRWEQAPQSRARRSKQGRVGMCEWTRGPPVGFEQFTHEVGPTGAVGCSSFGPQHRGIRTMCDGDQLCGAVFLGQNRFLAGPPMFRWRTITDGSEQESLQPTRRSQIERLLMRSALERFPIRLTVP